MPPLTEPKPEPIELAARPKVLPPIIFPKSRSKSNIACPNHYERAGEFRPKPGQPKANKSLTTRKLEVAKSFDDSCERQESFEMLHLVR